MKPYVAPKWVRRAWIVDQIPIMTVDDPKAPRERQISDLACGLRRLAKSENVLIVACSQLNSESSKRSNKRPTLQDIRESRAIGHYATRVIMLHDPTDGEMESPSAGEIEWIIRKNRQPRPAVPLLAAGGHLSGWRALMGEMFAESPIVNKVRTERWIGRPPGAEAEYEAKCAAWESLTDEDIWGGPRPPLPPIPAPPVVAP